MKLKDRLERAAIWMIMAFLVPQNRKELLFDFCVVFAFVLLAMAAGGLL